MVDTATNSLTATITTSLNGPQDLAVSPDGTKLWVANTGGNDVLEFCVTSGGCGSIAQYGLMMTIATGSTSAPGVVAITPNGAYLYEDNYGTGTGTSAGDTVGVFSTSTGSLVKTLTVGANPDWTTFTPDGQYAYVANCANQCNSSAPGSVSVIQNASSASPSRMTTLTTGFANAGATGIAILPDCTPSSCTAYVANNSAADLSIITGADSSSPMVSATTVTGFSAPAFLTATPDSKYLYVIDEGSGDVYAVATSTNTISQTFSLPAGSSPRGVAITPDQAPTAAFTATPAVLGGPSSFDASASSSPVGTVANYFWNFGDGSAPVNTASATTTHTYTSPGPFNVTLTVTNSAGTSTSVVYTGHTVANNGGPSATHSETISTAPGAPTGLTATGGTPAPL